jgi:C4-type Zn-finger protein
MKKSSQAEMDKVDRLVRETGRNDRGEDEVLMCPRCGSTKVSVRSIDIPGFAPEVYVCNNCGFKLNNPMEAEPLKVVEAEVEIERKAAVKKKPVKKIEKKSLKKKKK